MNTAVTAFCKLETQGPPSKDKAMAECILQVLAHHVKVGWGGNKVAAMWDFLLKITDPGLVSVINRATSDSKYLAKCTLWVQ